MSTTEIESPLAHLTRRADRGARKRVRRDSRRGLADLGDRDRRYIESMIEMHRRLARDGPRAADRLALQAGLGRRDRHALGGQDPREHGDRPQRPARPVGLDERPADPLLHVGLGHGVDRRGVEALPQLRPPHLHEHPRQGQGPRLRDHADRPASEVASGLPAPAALQPAADGVLRVGRRRPRPRHRGDPHRREVQGAAAARSSRASRQGAQPDRQGLRRVAADQRARRGGRRQPASAGARAAAGRLRERVGAPRSAGADADARCCAALCAAGARRTRRR